MKLAIAIIITLLVPAAQASDAGKCYAINDMDAKNFCLAKARKERSMCYTIQSSALRSQCLAEVG
jgi:hypothetical protein